jgi:hypothetical protein
MELQRKISQSADSTERWNELPLACKGVRRLRLGSVTSDKLIKLLLFSKFYIKHKETVEETANQSPLHYIWGTTPDTSNFRAYFDSSQRKATWKATDSFPLKNLIFTLCYIKMKTANILIW